MEWLVPDVPRKIQDKINHERYIDQRERWSTRTTEHNFKDAMIASEAIAKMNQLPNGHSVTPTKSQSKSPTRQQQQPSRNHPRGTIHVQLAPTPTNKR